MSFSLCSHKLSTTMSIIIKMGLKRSFKFYKNVLLVVLLISNLCFANKIHFSRWIKIDQEYPKEIFNFETIVNKGLEKCIESCKAKLMCKYINFRVNAHMCSLIGIANNTDEIGLYDDKIEKKKGYIFGRKHDWNLGKYDMCKNCGQSGECKIRDPATNIECQNSGCGPPEEIELATIQGNMFSIGNKVKYQCKEGYKNKYVNNGDVTCQSSGAWSTLDFKCIKDLHVCHEGSCYFLDQASRTWDGARSNCIDIGGHLAKIETESEYLFIKDNFKTTPVWLGGNLQITGNWVWSDDTPVEDGYTAWGPSQPQINSENCMAVWHDLLWHDVSCTMSTISLCEFN